MLRPWPAATLVLGLGGAMTDVALSAPPIPGAQLFQAAELPSAHGVSSLTPKITLAPVNVDELLAGSRPELGTRDGAATASGHGLTLNGALPLPPLARHIRRELPGVWRYAPKPTSLGIETVPQVRVELRSLQGRSGELSLRELPGVSVPVEMLASQQLLRSASGERWYEGSVVLEIPVSALLAAGTYAGRIEITLDSP